MIQLRNRRIWLLIAAIAIGIALLLTLVPHVHAGNAFDLLAILPVLFIGIAFSLNESSPLNNFCSEFAPDPPSLPDAFQRPPPHLA
jgi:hypothetical protein